MAITFWPNSYVITGSPETFHIVIGIFRRQTSNWWTSVPPPPILEASHSMFFHLSIRHLHIHSTSTWWIPTVKEQQIRFPFLAVSVGRHTCQHFREVLDIKEKNLGSFQEKELPNCTEISSSSELGDSKLSYEGVGSAAPLVSSPQSENRNLVLDTKVDLSWAVMTHQLGTPILCTCKIPIWKVPW